MQIKGVKLLCRKNFGKNRIWHTGTRLARDFCASTEEWGENPQRRNGTVRCDVFSDGAAARSLAGAGKALRKERAFAPHTKSGYSVPSLFGGFPAGAYASA